VSQSSIAGQQHVLHAGPLGAGFWFAVPQNCNSVQINGGDIKNMSKTVLGLKNTKPQSTLNPLQNHVALAGPKS